MVFAVAAFVLLGVLFGMQLTTFIFGNLNTAAATTFDLDSARKINETGAINGTNGYTLREATRPGFTNPTNIIAVNASSNVLINAANYTVSSSGLVSNATAYLWQSVNFTYNYEFKGTAQLISEGVSNYSLEAVETYSEQSDTQFSTIAIAITLVVLLLVFGLFWKYFVGSKGSGGMGYGNGRGNFE